MDRIDTSLLNKLTLTPAAKTAGPRAIDPTPRLRMTDRRDTVEIRGVDATPPAVPTASTTAPRALNSLVAASVNTPARAPTSAGNAALRMYASPGDQNAAATRLATNNTGEVPASGSVLDIRA